jgi:peptidoglycan hydrolase-like protein with peptidoglycan-binding domain
MDRKRGNGDVKQLQAVLQDLGYDLGDAGVDGKFGPQTAKALKAFQSENGLKDDAVFGRHTRRLLDLVGAKAHAPRGKTNAPLSADEEPLSPQRRRRRSAAAVSEAGVAAAEALLLVMEAPDHRPPTDAERKALWRRFPFVAPSKGADGGAVSLKRDKDGLFVHTHRARSKSFPTVAAIPERAVRFIESTG